MTSNFVTETEVVGVMNDGSPRKRRRTMMRLYPDEDERDALEQEGYPPDEPGPEFMDMAMPDSEQYAPEEDDEDQIYLQQAASDTLLALQLLRSQFPAKARVGGYCALHASQSAVQSGGRSHLGRQRT